MRSELHTCHDCNAKPGELHELGCDMETCPKCGGQLISCSCNNKLGLSNKNRISWLGEATGVAECREWGWYARRNPNGVGYIECSSDHPEATEDLNRLYRDAVWNKKTKRFEKK